MSVTLLVRQGRLISVQAWCRIEDIGVSNYICNEKHYNYILEIAFLNMADTHTHMSDWICKNPAIPVFLNAHTSKTRLLCTIEMKCG